MTGRRERRRKQLLDELRGREMIVEIERGNTRSHSEENYPWKKPWTCRETDYGMIEIYNVVDVLFTCLLTLLASLCINFCCVGV